MYAQQQPVVLVPPAKYVQRPRCCCCDIRTGFIILLAIGIAVSVYQLVFNSVGYVGYITAGISCFIYLTGFFASLFESIIGLKLFAGLYTFQWLVGNAFRVWYLFTDNFQDAVRDSYGNSGLAETISFETFLFWARIWNYVAIGISFLVLLVILFSVRRFYRFLEERKKYSAVAH
jgi:hypothetical protein